MQPSDTKVMFKPPERPIIYSSANNWKGVPLLTLKEFCLIIDTKRPTIIEEFLKNNSIDALKNFEFTPEDFKNQKYGWDLEKQELFDRLRDYRYNFKEVLNGQS